ncbi:MAG: hypothetical protein K0Q54_2611 [Methylobacterium brachiatum]|jgi:hypothetical protein|nr:hypothetical protein [Methylobacterium brachiatum]
MSPTPIWLGVLGAAVAALALIVSALQWQLARTKLVLDLFDRRLSIFEKAQKSCRDTIRRGSASNADIQTIFDIMPSSHFLFDSEVAELLENIKDCMIEFGGEDVGMPRDMTKIKDLRRLEQSLYSTFNPYLKMTQKRPWLVV